MLAYSSAKVRFLRHMAYMYAHPKYRVFDKRMRPGDIHVVRPQIDVCRILLMGKVYVQLGEGEVYSGIG